MHVRFTWTMHHKIASHVPTNNTRYTVQCTKFRVASSKFHKRKGAYAYACAPSTLSRNDTHHRITLIELHQCTKFGVDRSKFPRTVGPLANKLFRSWRAQPAPPGTVTRKPILGWGSIHVTCKFGISGGHRLACRGDKRTTGVKYLHVHCTCTTHPIPINDTAPSRPCHGEPMYRVWCR